MPCCRGVCRRIQPPPQAGRPPNSRSPSRSLDRPIAAAWRSTRGRVSPSVCTLRTGMAIPSSARIAGDPRRQDRTGRETARRVVWPWWWLHSAATHSSRHQWWPVPARQCRRDRPRPCEPLGRRLTCDGVPGRVPRPAWPALPVRRCWRRAEPAYGSGRAAR